MTHFGAADPIGLNWELFGRAGDVNHSEFRYVTMNRTSLALNIASGLSGWLQLQHVQKLGGLSGEDTARFLVSQLVNAQGQFQPAASQLPSNWHKTKKRIDVALKGRSKGATVWYGAIELKWPGESFDSHQVRLAIVQDAMRLTFIDTNRLNAKLLVIGGTNASLNALFNKVHTHSSHREERRRAFCQLLSRDLNNPNGRLVWRQWSAHFPEAGERVPDSVFRNFDGRLKTELLAVSRATCGGDMIGSVCVWNCKRTRGTAN